MEFRIKNKFFSFGGSSKVLDQNNNDLLLVKGRVFSLTRKKFIKSLDGKVLYVVKNRFWNFLHNRVYVCDPNGKQICTVTRNITIRETFTIEGMQNLQVIANGKIGLGFDLSILKDGAEIGHITRPHVQMTDTFDVKIDNPEDLAFVTAIIIAIDNIHDSPSKDTITLGSN